ncbi:cupin domain-containing protein [Acidipila sp. EB88]|uniref:cupin domain-containing protein n=1 Tax=Acidipila sp. EB88 TaxID=2305226 RepID=UPI000F5D6DC9|nr:cupin domain-containing protein [Acidipila sp. EB88]RRA49163.1 cupin domain-containing protein [Acidipila sp. EB88]RRA50007.1 cupin domain-containing protein [Acidipila sp. EB88]
MEEQNSNDGLSRRRFLERSSALLAAAASLPLVAAAQQSADKNGDTHTGVNERQPGPDTKALDAMEMDSAYPPMTDSGGQPPFKYPFSFAHKRIEEGGWTRQVTVRDLPISKKMAGVEMRLVSGGIRELHWHVGAEWAFMTAGSARITAVDQQGRAFVEDVNEGDLWIFPGGIPHSIQGLGPDGCQFLLAFDDGNFNEFETFLLTDWLHHTPKSVLAKNFATTEETFANVPKRELFIFQRDLPRPLAEEKKQVYAQTGPVPNSFAFFTGKMQPTKVTAGGSVKIVDRKNFPASNIAAAIVTLKPGGLRELHWHPNEDEWQYYVKGTGRMTVFAAGGHARTMDFHAGDVGYIDKSAPHYIENTGDTDLVFLEIFPTPEYQDISLGEWLAHTPSRLVNEHLGTGEEFLGKINKKEAVITPE